MFFAVPNLRSTGVFELAEPWNWTPARPVPDLPDKSAWRQWGLELTTQHAFISGVEGLDPRLRVSSRASNQPNRLHAFIADYDGMVDLEVDTGIVRSKPSSEFLPAYICRTHSGHSRLIWILETPVSLSGSTRHMTQFLSLASRNLRAKLWLRGFEPEAFEDIEKYYEIGSDWRPVHPDYRVSTNHVLMWMAEAAKNISFAEVDGRKIPLDVVSEEVEKRWPGRWSGPFEQGRRGVRFWDPSADNETAAVVHEDGMVCYTGPVGFMTWQMIFGRAWVEKFEADQIGPLLKTTVFDGQRYWVTENGLDWEDLGIESFSRELRCRGFNALKEKGKTCSQVDRVMNTIERHSRVAGARPFIFLPSGIITYKGEKVLNTSRVKVLEPAEDITIKTWNEGAQHFPMLHAFFSNFFDEETGVEIGALEWYLAWLKHFYENALRQSPQPGQAVFIAGGEGMGKTFLGELVLGSLLGGFYDGTQFLKGELQWSKDLAKSPVLLVDDQSAGSDYRKMMHYESMLRKLVASSLLNFNGKWKDTGDVLWSGRVHVFMNLDAESLRMLPSMEISIHSKISLLKTADVRFKFPERREDTTRIIRQELPYFARFLLDHRIPEHILNIQDNRFRIHPYHHKDLFQEAVRSGSSHAFLEILIEFLEAYKRTFPEKTVWTGSAVALLQELLVIDGLKSLAAKYTTRQVGQHLATLQSRGYNLVPVGLRQGVRMWNIPFDLAVKTLPTTPAKPTVADAAVLGEDPLEGEEVNGTSELSPVRGEASGPSEGAVAGNGEGVPGK